MNVALVRLGRVLWVVLLGCVLHSVAPLPASAAPEAATTSPAEAASAQVTKSSAQASAVEGVDPETGQAKKTGLAWLLDFTGRLHPAAVHFPIGALLLLAGLVVLGSAGRVQQAAPLWAPALAVCAVATALAALGGLANAYATHNLPFRPFRLTSTLAQHQALGVLLVLLSLVASYLGFRFLKLHPAPPQSPPSSTPALRAPLLTLRIVLCIIVALLAWQGYLGGELSHGESHLWPQ